MGNCPCRSRPNVVVPPGGFVRQPDLNGTSLKRHFAEEKVLRSVDRRKKVDKKSAIFDNHKALGKLKMRFDGSSSPGVGTGALVKFNNTHDVFILTAAHNLYNLDLPCEKREATKAWFIWKSNLPEQTEEKLEFEKSSWSIHPSYKVNGGKDGGDVAIIRLSNAQRQQLVEQGFIFYNPFTWFEEPHCLLIDKQACAKKLHKDAQVSIAGYPGEKEGVWYCNGRIKSEGTYNSMLPSGEYRRCDELRPRMLGAYDEIDTSPGQSGSPVVRVSQSGKNLMVVGVHIWGSATANYATMIKEEVFDWLQGQIGV